LNVFAGLLRTIAKNEVFVSTLVMDQKYLKRKFRIGGYKRRELESWISSFIYVQ
jgi:hypothetical protein